MALLMEVTWDVGTGGAQRQRGRIADIDPSARVERESGYHQPRRHARLHGERIFADIRLDSAKQKVCAGAVELRDPGEINSARH